MIVYTPFNGSLTYKLTVSLSTLPIFFFQAEVGIRAGHVTGVQTCALPIYRGAHSPVRPARTLRGAPGGRDNTQLATRPAASRFMGRYRARDLVHRRGVAGSAQHFADRCPGVACPLKRRLDRTRARFSRVHLGGLRAVLPLPAPAPYLVGIRGGARGFGSLDLGANPRALGRGPAADCGTDIWGRRCGGNVAGLSAPRGRK